MRGRMQKKQGFELAGTSLQKAWWMVRAQTKPLPLKKSRSLQTGNLLSLCMDGSDTEKSKDSETRAQMGLVPGRDI